MRKREILVLLILFLFAYLSFAVGGFGLPNIYQARDLHRALGILDGNFIWYGPDLTGGGRLPGPFYYWLLAIPLSISNSLESPQIFLHLITGLSAVLLFRVLEKNFSTAVGTAGFFFFLFSPVLRSNVESYWNPSYIYPFWILAIELLIDRENYSKPKRLAAAGLFLGLALQLHMTTGLFFIAGVFAIARLEFGGSRSKAKALATFTIATILPLTPYLIWRYLGPSEAIVFNQVSEGWKSLLSPIFKFVFLWKHFGSVAIQNVAQAARDSIGPFVVLGLAALVVHRKNPFAGRPFLLPALLVSALLLPWLMFDLAYFRYTVPFFLLVAIASAIAAGRVIETLPTWKIRALFAICVLSAFVPLFGGESSEAYARDADVPDPSPSESKELMHRIASETEWTYEDLRNRLVFVGVDRETDFSIVYEREYARRNPARHDMPRPDGAIIVPRGAIDVSTKEAFAIALESRPDVMPEIVEAFRSREAECRVWFQTRRFAVCLYVFAESVEPRSWNNVGYPYQYAEPHHEGASGDSGVLSRSSDEALFFIDGCLHSEPSCVAYFQLRIDGKKLIVRAYGDPLGVPDSAPNPSFALSLDDAKIYVTCDGRKTEWIFARRLGPHRFRDAFLSPFQNVRELGCTNPSSVELALDKGRSVTNIQSAGRFEPYHLTWNRTQ